MEETIFTKIIKGEIPSHKVYEDEKTYAFMDIQPIQPGMILVVPKAQVANFYELEDEDHAALWATVRRLARQMKQIFPEKQKIAVHVEGLEVEHTHVKIFPIDNDEQFHAKPSEDEPDHAALAEMAKKLKLE